MAFCCISTGLFGYPSDAAAAVALSSVARWLQNVLDLSAQEKDRLKSRLAFFRPAGVSVAPDGSADGPSRG